MKIGVLGGTFDPPHNGHLAIAEVATERLRLEQVLFVPAGDPWMKAGKPLTPADQREEMVRLAVAGHPTYSVSRLEIDRPGPSYTVDTLDALRWEFGKSAEFFFLLGFDALADLPRWHEPERLVTLCTLVAVTRPGIPRADVDRVIDQIAGLKGRLVVLEGVYMDVSATDIRRRVAQGLPISDLVPKAVEEYIREKGLFREE